MSKEISERIHCNDCGILTNQKILFDAGKRELIDEDDAKNSYHEGYRLVQCLGCDFISLEISTIYTNQKNKKGDIIEEVYFYPEGESYYIDDDGRFLLEAEIEYLPNLIYNTYYEVTTAIDEKSLLLSGIGLRTLVEAVCFNRKIEGRNLMEKINNLHKDGFISGNELPILHKLREIGNLSAHEIKSHSPKILEEALGIINHLLRSVYIIPKRAKKLNK